MERENLAGDAKGKGPSGSNREAESTDARSRYGLGPQPPSSADVATKLQDPTLRAKSCGEQMQQKTLLFDHLVGSSEKSRWHVDTELFGGLGIDD